MGQCIFFSFLLLSWVSLGMVMRKVRVSLLPLRMMTGPVQHFRSAILDAWRFHVFAGLSERQGFLGGEFSDFSWFFTTTYLLPPAGTR